MSVELKQQGEKREQSFGIKTIVIDGSPILKPFYATYLSDSSFINYLENSESVHEYGFASGPWMGGKLDDLDLLKRIAKDKRFPEFMESVVRNGKDSYATEAASQIADALAGNNQALELIPREKLKLPSKATGRKGAPETALGKHTRVVNRLGSFLEKGMIICRGNVDEVEDVRGGTLYIDGDVNKLTQCNYGIVYINGDLHHLGESEKVILIVTGRIHNYTQPKYSSGGLQLEITPSPFIFSSHELLGQRVGTKDRHECVSANVAKAFAGNFVVDEDDISNWRPQDLRKKALALCRKRIDVDLSRMREIAEKITDPKSMAEFYKKYILGYITGQVKGQYDAPSRFPADD